MASEACSILCGAGISSIWLFDLLKENFKKIDDTIMCISDLVLFDYFVYCEQSGYGLDAEDPEYDVYK